MVSTSRSTGTFLAASYVHHRLPRVDSDYYNDYVGEPRRVYATIRSVIAIPGVRNCVREAGSRMISTTWWGSTTRKTISTTRTTRASVPTTLAHWGEPGGQRALLYG